MQAAYITDRTAEYYAGRYSCVVGDDLGILYTRGKQSANVIRGSCPFVVKKHHRGVSLVFFPHATEMRTTVEDGSLISHPSTLAYPASCM